MNGIVLDKKAIWAQLLQTDDVSYKTNDVVSV